MRELWVDQPEQCDQNRLRDTNNSGLTAVYIICILGVNFDPS